MTMEKSDDGVYRTKFCYRGKSVPIPIFAVRRCAREAQQVFCDLHVKAWRKNGYSPVASQFDVPPVVAASCVLFIAIV